ncbi:hypothetical protein [Spiroplasma endosymbiont of Polydrusus formosus]
MGGYVESVATGIISALNICKNYYKKNQW